MSRIEVAPALQYANSLYAGLTRRVKAGLNSLVGIGWSTREIVEVDMQFAVVWALSIFIICAFSSMVAGDNTDLIASGGQGNLEELNLYVSPDGKDLWSGILEAPNAAGTDGPLATLAGARDAVRALKQADKLSGPVKVLIRGGRYFTPSPVVFEPEDSWQIIYSAYPGEEPVIDGGRRIEGWRIETQGDKNVWVTQIPEVAAGEWYFRQLFVNGERRNRPRLPKTGLYRIEALLDTEDSESFIVWRGINRFQAAPGHIQSWENLTDVDIVVLHYWIDQRMPIESFDPETRVVTSSRKSAAWLRGDCNQPLANYYVENVKEALTEPGEWYLNRKSGQLSYIPMPGEELAAAEVYAPVAEQLIVLKGNAEEGHHVEGLRFVGLTFRHTEWRQPPGGGEKFNRPPGDYANSLQAACHLPGVISLQGARNCAIEDCTIEHIGWYGIELTRGCQRNSIVGNTIRDIGAGGVKMESIGIANKVAPVELRTGYNRITDNRIYAGGRVFKNAVGILCMDAFGNEMSHNHIHDLFWTGIACGWTWGYRESITRDNIIEKNHIHDLGHGVLNDMGGVYILNVQPGTVVRGNLIHDVSASCYGGWGVYLDEGCSYVLVENNIAYNLSNQPFHVHYSWENTIRNNIFAFGRDSQIHITRVEEHRSFTFERNIVVSAGQPIFTIPGWNDEKPAIVSDMNLFWNTTGQPLTSRNEAFQASWRSSIGRDMHSIVADPKFRDLSGFDFTLAEDSPAFEIGFQPIDMSDVGPRRRN